MNRKIGDTYKLGRDTMIVCTDRNGNLISKRKDEFYQCYK